ncbi:hypothetical protein BDZ91DRAFT_718291 [Kalaharituber pfeilii]|nr:hypothetical protein BDZ91DRAFT_718291 [Kalaharituber pfeilii]
MIHVSGRQWILVEHSKDCWIVKDDDLDTLRGMGFRREVGGAISVVYVCLYLYLSHFLLFAHYWVIWINSYNWFIR